jgi:ABC-type transporter Mla subunit MlaD
MKYYSILITILLLTSCSDNRTEIVLNAENVTGLTNEANLIMNGLEVGEVVDMKIASNENIDISCRLNTGTKIPNDSKFRICNLDILGTKEIIVELGKSSVVLENGDVIPLSKTETISLGDSLGLKIGGFFESLIGTRKQDSILIELRRLNENLEKQ